MKVRRVAARARRRKETICHGPPSKREGTHEKWSKMYIILYISSRLQDFVVFMNLDLRENKKVCSLIPYQQPCIALTT